MEPTQDAPVNGQEPSTTTPRFWPTLWQWALAHRLRAGIAVVGLVLATLLYPGILIFAGVGVWLGWRHYRKHGRVSAARVVTTASVLFLIVVVGASMGASDASDANTADPTSSVSSDPAQAAPPDVVGWQLDEAVDELEDAGFDVQTYDSHEDRSIFARSNWVVTDQEVNGEVVILGAHKPSDVTPEPTKAEPTTPEPEPTTAEPTTAEPTTAEPTTAEPQPTTVHYKNCTDARAAGAAPIREGEPGYRSGLDRDGDGVACE